MRALCTGDNHLGSGPDLGRTPGERLSEQEQVWRQTLEIAREQECDVVLHGGDLFHRTRPSPEEVLAATRPLVEHRAERGCPVVMALGNHERPGVGEATMPAVLSLSELLHVSHTPEIVKIIDGQVISDLAAPGGLAICLLPWAPVSHIVAAQDGGDRDDVNAYAAELLVATARGLRDALDGPAILLSHFCVSGSSLPNGLPVDQLREPVLDLAELEALGFEAICLAHIHKASVFGEGTFYVGSPMALSFGEAGYDHGCFVLERDTLSGVYVPRFVPLESRRLATVDLTAEQALAMLDAEWSPWHPVRDFVVKIRLHATSEEVRQIDSGILRREAEAAGACKAFVELDVERPERARIEGMSEDLDELAALDAYLEAIGVNGDQAAVLRERTEAYLGAVRA